MRNLILVSLSAWEEEGRGPDDDVDVAGSGVESLRETLRSRFESLKDKPIEEWWDSIEDVIELPGGLGSPRSRSWLGCRSLCEAAQEYGVNPADMGLPFPWIPDIRMSIDVMALADQKGVKSSLHHHMCGSRLSKDESESWCSTYLLGEGYYVSTYQIKVSGIFGVVSSLLGSKESLCKRIPVSFCTDYKKSHTKVIILSDLLGEKNRTPDKGMIFRMGEEEIRRLHEALIGVYASAASYVLECVEKGIVNPGDVRRPFNAPPLLLDTIMYARDSVVDSMAEMGVEPSEKEE